MLKYSRFIVVTGVLLVVVSAGCTSQIKQKQSAIDKSIAINEEGIKKPATDKHLVSQSNAVQKTQSNSASPQLIQDINIIDQNNAADGDPKPSLNKQLKPIEFDLAKANTPSEIIFDVDDILHFTVWGKPELATQAKVQESGMITLPLIGSIVAKGKSPSRLKNEIEDELRKRATGNIAFKSGDRIRLFVWQNPDLSFAGLIRVDGNITFPLAGEIHAAGETVESLTKIVQQRMSKYLINPRVSILTESLNQTTIPNARVSILPKQLRPRKITVLGEVALPGLQPIHGSFRLADALAVAHYKDTAELNSIIVIRGYKNTQPQYQMVRMDDFINGKDSNANIYLKADDIIVVPKSMIAKVGQYVEYFFSRTRPVFDWWIALQNARFAEDVGRSTRLLNQLFQ